MFVALLQAGLNFQNSLHFYIVAIPNLVILSLTFVASAFYWRLGPDFAHHKLLQGIVAVIVPCTLPMLYFGYLGDIEAVPWNDRLIFSLLNFLYLFFASQAGEAGANMGGHPLEPRTSIVTPCVQATINSILLWDALTDMSLIRILVAQVCVHQSNFS